MSFFRGGFVAKNMQADFLHLDPDVLIPVILAFVMSAVVSGIVILIACMGYQNRRRLARMDVPALADPLLGAVQPRQ